MMDFTPYTPARAGLSDAQWNDVKDLFDCRRKRKHDLRGIVEGILYVLQSDENWRMLPASYAPWQTVYYYYDKWRKSGLWFQLVQRLPEHLRTRLIDDARPALSLVDLHIPSYASYGARQPVAASLNEERHGDVGQTAPAYNRRFNWYADRSTPLRESQAA